jgi:hypothetical protein
MMDPLFERSRLAIAENLLLRKEREMLQKQLETWRGRLRLTMLANATDRSARKTILDDNQ